MDSNDDADTDTVLMQLILILFLTLINAFFAMSELAVITASKTKIDLLAKSGNKKALKVQKLNIDQTKFLSTIQVGITLAGFFSSASAAVGLSDDLGMFLDSINIPYGNTIALVLITILLSFFTLIFGELFPKRIALANPEKIAMLVAGPITIIKFITTPFVKFLSGTCNLISKITGLSKKINHEKVSEDEIKYVVETGVNDGVLDEEKQKMIESVLKFNDLTATDIMTPRIATYMINIEDSVEEFLPKLIDEKYSRVPVYSDTRDNVIGILNTKDLLEKIILEGIDKINITDILRKPLFVRDLIKINKLFQLMKDTKNQFAILLDEFGGLSGIATMEDIVEEVVGNIYDEYDDPSETIKINDNEYIVSGATPIQEINRDLDLDLDDDNPNYNTIAGLIIFLLDRFPKGKEKVTIKNVELTVDSVKKLTINKVKVKIFDTTENK